MHRKICILLIVSAIWFAIGSLLSYASTGDQHDKYFEHALFGENWEKGLQSQDIKDAVDALESASFLAIDYTKGESQKEKAQRCLTTLQDYDVAGLPREIEKIDIAGGGEHRKYTHQGWEHDYSDEKEGVQDSWETRKKILLNTTEEVFDFGLFSNRFKHDKKCESFTAIVYYIHVLGDIVADKEYKGDMNQEKMNLVPITASEETGVVAELERHFKVVFADLNDGKGDDYSNSYNNLIDSLENFETETEAIVGQTGGLYYEETFQDYRNQAKKLLTEILPDKLPPLLQEEEFFKKVFYESPKNNKPFFGIGASIIQKNGGLKITTQHGGGADW